MRACLAFVAFMLGAVPAWAEREAVVTTDESTDSAPRDVDETGDAPTTAPEPSREVAETDESAPEPNESQEGEVANGEPRELPRVSLEIDPCVGVNLGSVERLSAIELGQDGVSGERDDAPIQVQVGCEVQIVVLVRYLDGQPSTRRLSLSALESAAQERLLALHISEAVAVARAELLALAAARQASESPDEDLGTEETTEPAEEETRADQGTPDVSAAEVEGVAPAADTPGEAEPRFDMLAAGGLLVSRDFIGGGGGLVFRHNVGRITGWSLDVAFHGSRSEVPLGRVGLFLFSASAQFRAGHSWNWFRLEGGGGVRFGYARLNGDPDDAAQYQGDSIDGAWGGPALQLTAAARASRWLVFTLGIEGAYSLFSVTGEVAEESAASFEGFWGLVQLGLGVGVR